jgi:hypothetical protein
VAGGSIPAAIIWIDFHAPDLQGQLIRLTPGQASTNTHNAMT